VSLPVDVVVYTEPLSNWAKFMAKPLDIHTGGHFLGSFDILT
jgi:hypothetical protein